MTRQENYDNAMRKTDILVVFVLFIVKSSCFLDLDEMWEYDHDQTDTSSTGNHSCPVDRKFKCDKHAKYRSYDGSCNNLDRPTLGMAKTPQARFLQPTYGKDDSPRNEGLPNPRKISNKLFNTRDKSIFSHKNTVELMAFGQFSCHGLVATPGEHADMDCCDKSTKNKECFQFSLPTDDAHFSKFNKTCMNFVRSAAADRNCFKDLKSREQLNEVSSYIDASMVYGSSKKQAAELRSFKGGKLKFKDGQLPENPKGPCKKVTSKDKCFLAGDGRVDEILNLVINHLLFVKVHNKIAEELEYINPQWNDEKIYQETRKIVGAILQHITYNEYLPNILGEYLMHRSGLSVYWGHRLINDYNPRIDPRVRNAYAVAGFRWGHSLIQNKLEFLGKDYLSYYDVPLSDNFFNNQLMFQETQPIKDFVRFLTHSEMMFGDGKFEASIRNHLFDDGHGRSFDLPARNIQRGRDHGIPPYNAWRQFCGLVVADFADDILPDHTKQNTKILKELYGDAWDIDLYAGAVSEIPADGSLLGPTFACIWINQYKALKFGDRFFYEWYRGYAGFTPEQLRSIKDILFSKLFCDIFHLDEIQKYVFRRPRGKANPTVKCSEFRNLDLHLWAEHERHY